MSETVVSKINDLSGVRGVSDNHEMPRVGVEPLGLARVPEVHGAKLGQELLRKHLIYSPETGHFTRRIGRKAGGIAGAINNNGYRLIHVAGHFCRAHRLAWLYVHGVWPTGEIDHINGVRDDNRLENLRDVSMVTNQQNRRSALVRNAVGLLGVSKSKNRYTAAIYAEGRDRHLGTFDTPEAAHAAYVDAKRELHDGCTL